MATTLLLLTALISILPQQAAVFSRKSDKLTVRYLLSTKQQTDTVRDQLVNIVNHLAAKETFPSEVGGYRNS